MKTSNLSFSQPLVKALQDSFTNGHITNQQFLKALQALSDSQS